MEESKPDNISTLKKDIIHLCKSRKKNPSLNWAAHIYQLINELCPSLLNNDNVIKTFHEFINCLYKYEKEHHTYYFNKYTKYSVGIELKLITNGINNGKVHGMPSRFIIHDS